MIKKPLSATIIEEIKAPPPPPPPPPKKIIEPPKARRPSPTCRHPTFRCLRRDEPVIIGARLPTPPPEPYVIAPPGRRAAAPAAAQAGDPQGITPIKREEPEYPSAAIRTGIEKGRVVARLKIDEKGNVYERHHRVGGPAAAFRSRRDRRASRNGSSLPKARSTSARSKSISSCSNSGAQHDPQSGLPQA